MACRKSLSRCAASGSDGHRTRQHDQSQQPGRTQAVKPRPGLRRRTARAASAQTEVAQNEQNDDDGTDEPDDAIHDCFLPGWRFLVNDGRTERRDTDTGPNPYRDRDRDRDRDRSTKRRRLNHGVLYVAKRWRRSFAEIAAGCCVRSSPAGWSSPPASAPASESRELIELEVGAQPCAATPGIDRHL